MENRSSNPNVQQKRSIAVLFPYWSFWESSLDPVQFRLERETILSEVSEFLVNNSYQVLRFPFVDSPELGESIAEELSTSNIGKLAKCLFAIQSKTIGITIFS